VRALAAEASDGTWSWGVPRQGLRAESMSSTEDFPLSTRSYALNCVILLWYERTLLEVLKNLLDTLEIQ
jgi:hypothetical protein